MPTLRLLAAGPARTGHQGECLACTFTADGGLVLSGGWDGFLRVWDARTGAPESELSISDKPLSACAASPDERSWLAGTLEGFLCHVDAPGQRLLGSFVAHSRPIAAIVFHPDGRTVATASWDRHLGLWDLPRERERRPLAGHGDIVAGCRFTPDGRGLLSWSYDGTLALWDAVRLERLKTLAGHSDRVTAGAIHPDGRWAVSGSRDRTLKLWDLAAETEIASCDLEAEARACFVLLDGKHVAAMDAEGRLTLHALPDLAVQADLYTDLPVQCAALAPTGEQIALGCSDGGVRLVAVEGFDAAPMVVTATRTSKRTATKLQRLFGRSHVTHAYRCTCPACRQSFEVADDRLGQGMVPCPHCRRNLCVSSVAPALQPG